MAHASPAPESARRAVGGARRSQARVVRTGPAAHLVYLLRLADAAALLLAFPLTYVVKTRLLPADLTNLYDPSVYLAPAALLVVGTLIFLERRGAYRFAALSRPGSASIAVGLAVGQTLVLVATVLFAFKSSHVSRLFVGLYGGAAIVLLLAVRGVFRRVARLLRASGASAARVLVVGEGREVDDVVDALAADAPLGIEVMGRVAGLEEARRVLSREAIDEIAVAARALSLDDLDALAETCAREGLSLHAPLSLLGPHLASASIDHDGEAAVLSFSPQAGHWAWGRAVKRAIDLLVAPLLLLATAPIWIVGAVAIRLDSPGPIFFMQERIGLNKRRFRMFKFRTMVDGAEQMRADLDPHNEADGPIFKLRRDPRVTRVGRWLRRFDFDELPQLLNVLRGEMSLIGPRPMLEHEIAGFEPWQRKRFSMLPGITGLWQVSNRIGDPFLRGLATDLDYIDRWSLGLDLQILLRTVPAVLRDRVAP